MVGRPGLGPIRSKTAIKHLGTNVEDIAGFGSVECGERDQVDSLAAVSGGLSSVGGGRQALQSDLSRAPDRVLPSREGGVGPEAL